jgi:hypothetical protein
MEATAPEEIFFKKTTEEFRRASLGMQFWPLSED